MQHGMCLTSCTIMCLCHSSKATPWPAADQTHHDMVVFCKISGPVACLSRNWAGLTIMLDSAIWLLLQMRAARLAHQLCRSSHWADALTAAGGVHAAVQLLWTFNNTAVSHRAADQSKLSSLLLAVVRLLLRAASLSAVAMVALTQEPQLLNVLMQQLLDSAAAPTQGKAKVTAVAAATATTDTKLVSSHCAGCHQLHTLAVLLSIMLTS